MPTSLIRRPAVTTPAISHAVSVNPLAIVAAILFAALHIVAAVTLERSHARPALATSIENIDDDVSCPAKADASTPALPFD